MRDINCALEVNSSSYSLVAVDAGLKVLAAKRIGFNFDISSLSFVDEVFLDYLRKIMREFVRDYGFKVKKLNICLPHYQVSVISAYAEAVLHPYRRRDVKRRDIDNLVEQSRLLRIDWDKNVIHSFPVEFSLDGRKFLDPPWGVYGRKLGAKSVFCLTGQDIIDELETLAEKLSLELDNIVFYPLSLMAGLSLPNLEDSFLLVRVRRYRTDVAVFAKHALVYAGYLPIGGEYVDREVADALGIPVSLAEEIKIEYGALGAEDLEDEREVIIKKVSSYRSIKRSRLNQILLASFRNILGGIKRSIPEELRARINKGVFVGGVFSLRGLYGIAESELNVAACRVSLIRDEYRNLPPSFWGALGSFYFQKSVFNRQRYQKRGLPFWQKIVNMWDNYF